MFNWPDVKSVKLGVVLVVYTYKMCFNNLKILKDFYFDFEMLLKHQKYTSWH